MTDSNKTISRQAYADMFGPTKGDKVRLADTELWIEVENDYTTYGDEVKFGGGKVIRDGMGQSQSTSEKVMDCVKWNSLEHLKMALKFQSCIFQILQKKKK